MGLLSHTDTVPTLEAHYPKEKATVITNPLANWNQHFLVTGEKNFNWDYI